MTVRQGQSDEADHERRQSGHGRSDLARRSVLGLAGQVRGLRRTDPGRDRRQRGRGWQDAAVRVSRLPVEVRHRPRPPPGRSRTRRSVVLLERRAGCAGWPASRQRVGVVGQPNGHAVAGVKSGATAKGADGKPRASRLALAPERRRASAGRRGGIATGRPVEGYRGCRAMSTFSPPMARIITFEPESTLSPS